MMNRDPGDEDDGELCRRIYASMARGRQLDLIAGDMCGLQRIVEPDADLRARILDRLRSFR